HADDRFAVARARDTAERALRVRPAPDQRAVADAPRELARDAAGGGRGGDRAVPVHRDGTDGSLHGRQPLVMARELARGHERLGVALAKPLRAGEGKGAVADEEDV